MNNTMKHFYTILFVLCFPLFSIAQSDYYVIDSSFYAMQLVNGGDIINAKFCQVKKGEEIISYTPYEVSEYGFKNGQVFVSKEIQIADSSKRVFLERLHQGETTLYYYRAADIKTFFIQKDDGLFVEMPKQNTAGEDYSQQLLALTGDCSNVSDASKLVSYKKRYLSKLIARYNTCELKPFPHFKYGLLIGYELSKLVPSEKSIDDVSGLTVNKDNDLDHFDYKYNGSFSIGMFLDNPILASDFSLHAEVLFSKHKHSYSYTSNTKKLDLTINTSSLRIPLLIRYTLPKNNFRPYFNVGPVYSYNLKNENSLYKETITFTDLANTKVDFIEGTIIPTSEFGFAIGFGFEFDLDFKKALFLEIRYSEKFGATNDYSSRNSMIGISTGINF